MRGMDVIDFAAREVAGKQAGEGVDHWYLRIPTEEGEGWTLPMTADRRIPPAGAVSYLVRFHSNVPVMRLDVDANFWTARIQGNPDCEAAMFEALDYCTHEQTGYGQLHPLHASRARTRLSESERRFLRGQLVDEAVRAGLKRSQFRDTAQSAVGEV